MATVRHPGNGQTLVVAEPQVVELRTSPHFKRAVSVDTIMLNVVYALMPVTLFAVYAFGISALAMIVTATVTCVLTEHVLCRVSGKDSTVGDYSAVITGLLLGLTLPPGFPLWMTAVGAVIAIAMGKALFGGLGFNVFNPALVGRAFLQAAFPVAITTWVPNFAPTRFTELVPTTLAWPFMTPAPLDGYLASVGADGFTGATPLMAQKFDHVTTPIFQLFWGTTAGSAGETSAILILICGAYLAWRGMLNWRIPTGILATVYVLSAAFYLYNPEVYPRPGFMLFSGGLMLCAVFMATDMVASPVAPWGVWIYAGIIGAVTVVIRLWGGLPEGAMYAVLLGNAVSPIIDNLTQSRIYGAHKRKVKA
jgi:Na+-translocating ferredoxin:NAD+ oxidoreductase subunit D